MVTTMATMATVIEGHVRLYNPTIQGEGPLPLFVQPGNLSSVRFNHRT